MRQSKTQLSILPVIFFGLALAFAHAQTKPNLTGMWKLNTDKSDFGGGGGPSEVTLDIRHQDPELLMTHDMGGQTIEFKLGTDGKEYVNQTPDGDMKSTLHWEKEVLIVNSDYAGQATFKDRWSLEDGGRTLRIKRQVSGAQGDTEWLLVFEKQEKK